ncbi:hypothetical protein EIP86_000378 [Pleurotus ostreatoroseus]|nr:hypothetical protein EIP86_000378 [Pleurotus ostreatoroseus]
MDVQDFIHEQLSRYYDIQDVQDLATVEGEDHRDSEAADTQRSSVSAGTEDDSEDKSHDVESDLSDPRPDDIKTRYHPHAGLATRIDHFEDYGHEDDNIKPTTVDHDPLSSFGTRVEFDFAEIALEACLNRTQLDALLSVVDRIRKGEPFGFRKSKDVEAAWERASQAQEGFQKNTFTQAYKKEKYSFDVYYRDLLPWMLGLIADVNLAPHLRWDASKLFKRRPDGTWMRYVHEPWTGDLWWKLQSLLPIGGKGIFLAIYADKTRLSSMGHVQGYPLMGVLLNAPVEIRNGSGFGSGMILGWLPIVKDDEDKKKTKSFINFKRAVWHRAVRTILANILPYCKSGFRFECGDGITRTLYPRILFLVADYEEQCTMALIRGLGGLAPCPVCVVPAHMQHDLITHHPERNADAVKSIVLNSALTKALKEVLLKELGMRDLPNVFWDLPHLKIAKALCFDRLHANHIGLFKTHLWKLFLECLEELGRDAKSAIDEMMNRLPRWRNFNHFTSVVSVEFSDGTKWEDISKAQAFPAKDWNFIKLHYQQHSYEDILAKGASRNYNTKPFEKRHRPLKKTYQLQTNFKDVANQILRIDHYLFTACSLRAKLDALDEYNAELAEEDPPSVKSACLTFGRLYLGSPLGSISFEALEASQHNDTAFHQFRGRFAIFSNLICPLGQRKWRAFPPETKIRPFKMLKVDFESMVTWRIETDMLRCSEKFHGRARFDGILFESGSNRVPTFGKLLYIFAAEIDGKLMPFALVLPLDKSTGRRLRKDEDLVLHRLRARPRKDTIFVHLDTIIRGVLLAEDSVTDGDYFVVDVVDTDWFLRGIKIFCGLS